MKRAVLFLGNWSKNKVQGHILCDLPRSRGLNSVSSHCYCGYDFIWERWTVNSFRWYCGLNVTPPRGSGIRTPFYSWWWCLRGCGTFRGGYLWRSSSQKLGFEALWPDGTSSSYSASWLWTQCDKPSYGSYCHSFPIYCLCLPCPGGWQPSGAVSQNNSILP